MANKSQKQTTEQQPSRLAKRPFFAYLYAYCIVRDLTEQEALEEISAYSGAPIDTLRASFTDQEQFNSMPTSVTMKISMLFNFAMQGMEILSPQDGLNLMPLGFDTTQFQVNANKYKWFKQSLKDDKRFAIQPAITTEQPHI